MSQARPLVTRIERVGWDADIGTLDRIPHSTSQLSYHPIFHLYRLTFLYSILHCIEINKTV